MLEQIKEASAQMDATRLLEEIEQKIDAESLTGDRSLGDVQLDRRQQRKTRAPGEKTSTQ
jgi:hypothetical protein